MALELNGTTGVSLVQDGVVTAADLASGAAASNLGTGNVTASMLASTLDLTGKTVTLPSGTGGKVLQVISSTKTDTASGTNLMSSNSWANVLSCTITPSKTSSKILIMYSISVSSASSGGDSAIPVRLTRNSTAIAIADAASNRARTTNGASWSFRSDLFTEKNMNYLDSPSTTSAITYYVQLAARGTGGYTWYCNRSYDDADTNEQQRAVSTITVMEISA